MIGIVVALILTFRLVGTAEPGELPGRVVDRHGVDLVGGVYTLRNPLPGESSWITFEVPVGSTGAPMLLAQGAPGGPPGSFYRGMPNVASVFYKFCWPGGHCVERQPQVWGQVCTVDHEYYAETVRPVGSRFVSWRCEVFGPVVGGIPTSGLAKKQR